MCETRLARQEQGQGPQLRNLLQCSCLHFIFGKAVLALTYLQRNIVRPEANHHETTPDTQHSQDENRFHAELESSRAAPCLCNLTRILLRHSSAAHVFGAASCAGRNVLLFFNPFRPSPLDITRSTVPSMKLHSLSLLQWTTFSIAWLPSQKNLFACEIEHNPGLKIRGVNLGSLFVVEPWMAGTEWTSMAVTGNAPSSIASNL